MKIISAGYAIETQIKGIDLLKQIERVGRTCYKSEANITEISAINFVETLIKNGHEAMLEHNAITVRFICDRGISHELVRHRLASFAQESTRYCNYSNEKFGNELTFIDIRNSFGLDSKIKKLDIKPINQIYDEWLRAMQSAERHYITMINAGATPQIARSVLPNSIKTEIVVTMNLREWRHFFKLRTVAAAHPQMREITIPLLKELRSLIPVIFDDIKEGK